MRLEGKQRDAVAVFRTNPCVQAGQVVRVSLNSGFNSTCRYQENTKASDYAIAGAYKG